jgi:hypothetical protein
MSVHPLGAAAGIEPHEASNLGGSMSSPLPNLRTPHTQPSDLPLSPRAGLVVFLTSA